MIRVLFSLMNEISIPSNTEGISGDLLLNGQVYEIKGKQGRLDGANVERIMDVIGKHEELNNGKGGMIFDKEIVQ